MKLEIRPALRTAQIATGIVLLIFAGAGLAKIIVDLSILWRTESAPGAQSVNLTAVMVNIFFSISLMLGIGGLGVFSMSDLRPRTAAIIIAVIASLWTVYGLIVGITGSS